MKEKLYVGITSGYDSGQLVDGWPLIYTTQNIVQMIEKQGHLPLIIPILENIELLDDLLDHFNCIILTGEVLSVKRNVVEELKTNVLKNSNPLRYDNESYILKVAIKKKIPVLGICRGFQVMALELGGKVLDGDVNENNYIIHQQGPTIKPSKTVHSVSIVSETILNKLLNTNHIMVNSFHRQSVIKIPNDFKVNAIAEDGVIEGIEKIDDCINLGIQFHPEMLQHNIWNDFFKNWFDFISSNI